MSQERPRLFESTSRFEYIELLGSGGFGVVYRVYDKEREEQVALKTIHQLNRQSLLQFKQEFRMSILELSIAITARRWLSVSNTFNLYGIK